MESLHVGTGEFALFAGATNTTTGLLGTKRVGENYSHLINLILGFIYA